MESKFTQINVMDLREDFFHILDTFVVDENKKDLNKYVIVSSVLHQNFLTHIEEDEYFKKDGDFYTPISLGCPVHIASYRGLTIFFNSMKYSYEHDYFLVFELFRDDIEIFSSIEITAYNQMQSNPEIPEIDLGSIFTSR